MSFKHLQVGDYVVVDQIEREFPPVLWRVSAAPWRVKDQHRTCQVVNVTSEAIVVQSDTCVQHRWAFSPRTGYELENDATGHSTGYTTEVSAQTVGVRIARAHMRKPSESYTPPTCLPLDLHRYFEYPGQPIVLAAMIIREYPSPEMAGLPALTKQKERQGFCSAEGHLNIRGAGNQATKTVNALLTYRSSGSIDDVISRLHRAWRSTVGGGNHDEAFEPGQQKAEALEPMLREALKQWL